VPISYVKGQSGKIYPFNVSGLTPNEVEKQKINEVLIGLGDTSAAPVDQEEDKSAIGQAFGRGVDTLQLGFGSALEGLGKTTGLDFLEEFGEEVVETNKQQLSEAEQYATRLDDVKDIGSGFDFFGQALAEQSSQLASTIGGSAAGAAVGTAVLGPVGTIVGGVVGGLAANLPFFYGMNREAQKEQGGPVNEGVAALTAIPQSALDFIADRIVVGSLLTPALVKGGGLFTRGIKGVGVGAVVEAPTEVGQQVLERMQAGQDIMSPEAIKEYKEVAIVAGLVGGTVRGTTQAVDNFDKKEEQKKKAEIEEDLSGLRSEVHRSSAIAQRKLEESEQTDAALNKIATDGMTLEKQEQKRQQELENITAGDVKFPVNKLDDQTQETLRGSRAQRAGSAVGLQDNTITVNELRSLRLDSIADTVEQKQKGAVDSKSPSHAVTKRKFNQEQYDAAVKKVIEENKADVETIQSVAKDDKGDAVAPSVAEDIRDEMIANRVIRQTEENVHVPLTEQEIANDVAAPLRGAVSQEQKRLESLRKQKEKQLKAEEKLKNRWKGTPKEEQDLEKSKVLGDEIDKAILLSEERAIGLQRQVDVIDSRTGAKGDLKQQQYTQEQANTALEASSLASVAEQTMEYKKKADKIARQLAKDLKKMVGADVKFGAERMLPAPPGVIVEGQYDPSKKMISLAMGIHDAGLTESQRLDKLRSVLNHEVIHALRDIGLFTRAEYDILVKAASKRKYTIVQNGQNVERSYNFIDRARRINQKRSDESFEQYEERVHEEAIAEMFRSWADGRLKVAGKPLSLFKRIVNFFKGVQDTHVKEGFNTSDSIFEKIQTGDIALRERGELGRVQPRDRTRQADLSSIPVEKSEIDVQQLKNFIINNPDGFTVTIDGAPTPKTGFAVAPIKQTEIVSSAKKFTIEDVKAQVRNILNLVQAYKDTMDIDVKVYAGGWFDADNNQYVLDASVIIDDKADALYIGDAGGQDAIANLGAINQGDFDNAIIGTETGIEQTKQDGTYRGELKNVRRADHAKLVKRFEELRVRDRRRDQLSGQLDRSRDDRVDVAPQVDENGLVTLTHFSRLDNLTEIDPERQGSNFSMRGKEEARRNMHGPKGPYGDIYPARSYFGLNLGQDSGYKVEYSVGENRYETKIPIESLYNFKADPDGFKKEARVIAERNVRPFSPQTQEKDTVDLQTSLVEKMIKDAGYEGYWTNSSLGMAGAVFSKKKVTTQSDLSSIPSINVARMPKKEEITSAIQKTDLKKYLPKIGVLAGLHRLNENSTQPLVNPEDESNPFAYTPLRNEKGKPIPMKKEAALALLQEERGGTVLDPQNDQDLETIAQAFAAFAEPAIKRDSSAIGWYEQKLMAAKELLHNMGVAEGKNRTVLSDPEMEAAFDFALSITSNGMSVVENFEAASEQLKNWEETGRFIEKGYGERIKPMKSAFAFYNALKDDNYSDLEIADRLIEEQTVSELKKHPLVVEYGLTVPSGELASESMPVAFLFGPKIGAGFYMNLRGDFNRLTADVWFMRLWNYISGTPFKAPKAADIEKNKDLIRGYLEEGPKNNFEKMIITEVMQDNNIDIITDGNIENLAVLLSKRFQREFNAASGRNTAKIKKYAQERGINWKSEEAKQNTPNLEERPEKTDIFVKADTLTKQLSPQEQATPMNATQRKYIRKTIERSREILSEGGYDINTADFQAVVWYPMKQLMASLNVAKGSGSDNDYVDGAIALVRREGATDEQISQALPDSERQRIDTSRRAIGENEGVRRTVDEDVSQPVSIDQRGVEKKISQTGVSTTEKQADVDAIQEELLVEAFTEELSEEDQESVQPVSDLAENNISDDQVDFSLIPPEKPLSFRVNPRAAAAAKKGELATFKNPAHFGYIKDADGIKPVVLFNGQDVDVDRKIETLGSFGLFHIINRNHHTELRENSKYKNVEQAIYDMLGDWADQGYQDGQNVIAIPDGGAQSRDIRMEYIRPKTKSVPLVMSLMYIPPSMMRVGNGMYAVRTFFPDSAAKSQQIADMSSIPLDFSSSHLRESQNSIVYAKSYDVLKKALKLVTLGSEEKAEKAANTFGDLFQDKFLPIAQVVDKLRAEGATIDDAFDPYLQETLYHGRVGNRIEESRHAFYEPIAEKVKQLNLDDGTNYDVLASGSEFVRQAEKESGSRRLAVADAYLYAVHAKERNAYIRSINEGEDSGSGMRDREADFIINWVNSTSQVNQQTLKDISSAVGDVVTNTNKVREEGGLIPLGMNEGSVEIDESGNTVEAPNFENYVPLRGLLDPDGEASEEGQFGSTGGTSYSIRGKEDRRMLGRSEYATSVLAGVFMQNQNSIIRSEKNAVGKSFLDLVRSDPERMSEYAVEIKGRPMKRGLVNGSVKMVPDLIAKNDDSILVVKVDGKEVLLKTRDPRVAKALKGSTGLSTQTTSGLVRAFGKFNRYLSNINTTYNPEFLVTNMLRDIQTAGVNVNQYEMQGLTKEILGNYKQSFKGVKDVVRGLRRDAKTGQRSFASDITKEMAESQGFDIENASPADLFRLFQIYGGQNALNQMDNLSDQLNNIKGVLGEISEAGLQGKWNNVKNSFVGKKAGSLLNFLDDYNTVVENAIRVATFKSLAPKIGFEKAAFAARNVTVDFAKGGEYKNFMNSVYLFYNASLQGSFALINAATRSPTVRKIWVSSIMFGIAMDQLNSALSEEDEDGELVFDKAPDYVLEHNILLPDPFGTTDRSHISIPLPYGLNIGVNFGRSLSRLLRGGYDGGEAASSIFMTAADALNPLGGTNNFYNFVAPTVADPFVDIMRNEEEFSGRPIVKETSSFDPTPPPESQLFWSTTSPSLKWVTENINKYTGGSKVESGLLDVSPDMIDYWIGYLTGGAGMFINRTVDFTTETMPSVLTEGFEDEFVRQTPFLRRIFYSVSEREDVAGFIENRNKVLKAREVLEAAMESGDMASIRDVRGRFDKELSIFGQVKSINSARNRIIRKLREIDANPRLSDEQKKKVTERLRENLEKLVQRGNKIMGQADI